MGLDSSLATVALIVSLIALLVTLTQLLQQIFGTADGYQRCQESIVGPWARLRHRKVRWSELRMETQFMTPELIIVDESHPALDPRNTGLFNTRTSAGFVSPRKDLLKTHVSWLLLMTSIQDLEQNIDSYIPKQQWYGATQPKPSDRTHPAFEVHAQSWDLMPPDIVRPLATTTLGNILVIAHRLGMDWTVLDPAGGHLHAEGHGQSLSSIEMRNFGLALRYTDKDPQKLKTESFFRASTKSIQGSRQLSRLFVPTTQADKMAFGFIPADPTLGTEEYDISAGDRKFEGIQDTLSRIKVKWKAISFCTRSQTSESFFSRTWKNPAWNGIGDAIYLLTPWLPLLNSGATQVRLPHHHVLQTPFNYREGQVVFWLRLKKLATETSPAPPILQNIAALLDRFAAKYSDNFIHIENLPHTWRSMYDSPIATEQGLKDVKEMYDAAVSHLKTIRFPYVDLVASHIEMATDVHKNVLAMPEQDRRSCDEIKSFHYSWMVEQAHQYVENFHLIQQAMQERHPGLDPEEIRDAWWSMVLKGIAWKFSIQPHTRSSYAPMSAPIPVPSHFWGNELPIYIT